MQEGNEKKTKKNKGLLVLAVALLVLGLSDDSWQVSTATNTALQPQTTARDSLPRWKPGLLDIHHLYVGSSVSTFVIWPDATTMLVDAGEIDLHRQRAWWQSLGPPYDTTLKALDPVPDSSKSPSAWILDYLHEFWPLQNQPKKLDYLLVTHFHSDHIGDHPQAGVPFIASRLPIQTLIDRGYPDYDVPRGLRQIGDKAVDNYLRFINATSIPTEQFQVGSTQQVRPRHEPHRYDVELKVVKSGDTVLVPSTNTIAKIPNVTIVHWNENAMSAAFVLRFGAFRYYQGGDQQILQDKSGTIVLDTIGPTARATGRVDVATLNHHGHGVTQEFVDTLDSPVVILQAWCSDQPPVESIELLAGNKQRQIFATHVFPERLNAVGPRLAKLFASTSGHIVVRVHSPPANKQRATTGQLYEVFVLDGRRKVSSHHGPYHVRG
jgi:glyoxylase-like metal-dependent hydrolase (beta-lactamase superfamily II)